MFQFILVVNALEVVLVSTLNAPAAEMGLNNHPKSVTILFKQTIILMVVIALAKL